MITKLLILNLLITVTLTTNSLNMRYLLQSDTSMNITCDDIDDGHYICYNKKNLQIVEEVDIDFDDDTGLLEIDDN